MKKKKNKRNEKLAVRISAVTSACLIIVVGVLCTSPSKAAEDAPYFPPDIETEPSVTAPFTDTDYDETTVPETTVPETTAPETTGADTGDGTDAETTVPETTVPETTVPETTVPETTVPETTAPLNPSGTEGKQSYREYNGRTFGENETFVGEYKTDRVQIGVSNVREGELSYYICDIKIASPSDFRTAFANGKISSRAYATQIAASVGAGFAVNGDFCGYHSDGIIIRDGGLYRNKKSSWDLCYLNKYGDLIVCKNNSQDGKSLVNDGVLQSWCFGPILVDNYKAIPKDQLNTPKLSRSAKEPRTAIGQIDELHYIFLVVDAKRIKNGISWTTHGGMSFSELAATFESLGCKTAYNLDGGGSTTMWLNGKLANEPAMEGLRNISDIIYFK